MRNVQENIQNQIENLKHKVAMDRCRLEAYQIMAPKDEYQRTLITKVIACAKHDLENSQTRLNALLGC
ncbi:MULTISPECIES: hypothetical protein [unclassified Fibrobacter]|uniref:hypothetical protein n=1 Tax=unclassified Fibrobacter TaxID=2634177 RepID=UPI000D6C4C84|nr:MULTISPECIES: hypothetical protein [unclassified Fibrobacter]PWJ60741.1 hypothetical protein BGX12_13611 [Fibrobacter sp. UWR4]PZW64357.1 hypothetical protein C8E88_103811 [Fibrobacter sp. UWR1]